MSKDTSVLMGIISKEFVRAVAKKEVSDRVIGELEMVLEALRDKNLEYTSTIDKCLSINEGLQ